MNNQQKSSPMLEAENLHKIYTDASKEVHVLRGVTLKIEPKEVIAIVGPSGAGKSTLLHILGGLDEPTRGRVLFFGEDVYRMKERNRSQFRNGRIGFIFQFYHLLPEFTALENIVLPGMIKQNCGMTRALRDRGMELLNEVRLSPRAHHRPSELSGGEQQRVAIARALMNQPDVLFCDEPTGNLDSHSGEEIIKLLMQLNRSQGQTLVIVTHDEKIAAQAQRVIYLKDGEMTANHVKNSLEKVRVL